MGGEEREEKLDVLFVSTLKVDVVDSVLVDIVVNLGLRESEKTSVVLLEWSLPPHSQLRKCVLIDFFLFWVTLPCMPHITRHVPSKQL